MTDTQYRTMPEVATRLGVTYDQARYLVTIKGVVAPLKAGRVRLVTDEQIRILGDYIRSHPLVYGSSVE